VFVKMRSGLSGLPRTFTKMTWSKIGLKWCKI
jgi:hypothetical protein